MLVSKETEKVYLFPLHLEGSVVGGVNDPQRLLHHILIFKRASTLIAKILKMREVKIENRLHPKV